MKTIRRSLQLLAGLARELSDEGAYHRYLQGNGKIHSAQEWRAYIDGRHRKKFQNAKCC